MKKTLLFLIMTLSVVLIFANGLSLNSVGPRALGMGGAFVGLADDASAIYWNPASLATQGNSFRAILTDVIPLNSYKYDSANIDAEGNSNHYFNPNLFFNYRKDKLAFGLGVYVPAGLGSEYEGKELKNLMSGIPGSDDIEWMSKIGVVNTSPTIAYSLNEKLSFGIALNIYYGMFDLKRLGGVADTNGDLMPEPFQYEESSAGLGYSATFSTKYQHNEKLSFGLTYRMPTKVTLEGEAENDYISIAGSTMNMVVPNKSDFEREVTWPMWLAAGFAFKPMENLTLTMDAQYSQWSEIDKMVTEFDNDGWAILTGASEDDTFVLNWEDKTQIRVGAEYKVKENLGLLCGYYYDPAPAPDETLNVLFPSSTNHTATTGFSFKHNQFDIDFGMEYLFGADRDVDQSDDNMAGVHHLDVFAWSFGVGYRF